MPVPANPVKRANLFIMRKASLFTSLALALWLSPAAAEAPLPPRPNAQDADARVREVFDAIVHDDPARASEAFFPREPFLQVKSMANPGRYYDRLRKRFEQDIHTLHAARPGIEHATFERFEMSKRTSYVQPNEEGNRLGYWAARHSWLYYRLGEKVERIEVRVMITWAEHWYVIHLSEFH
jgi:hypothetical protein